MIKSKGWDWAKNKDNFWRYVADEFLPVALEWKANDFKNVLDLGCGIGRNALYLAKIGFSVNAFDLSEDGLSQLKKDAQTENVNMDLALGDMLTLPYETGGFDCLLAFHSIYHTDFLGLTTVISEINRVTKKDGQIFITLNSKESDAWVLFSGERIDEYTLLKTEGLEVDIPHTYLEYADVLNLIKDFQILRIQQIFDYWEGRKHAHFFIRARKI